MIILRGRCADVGCAIVLARLELEDAETPRPKPGGAFGTRSSNQSFKESPEDVAATCACAALLKSNCLKSSASSSIGVGGLISGWLILLLGCASPRALLSKLQTYCSENVAGLKAKMLCRPT